MPYAVFIEESGGKHMGHIVEKNQIAAIINARIFDGEQVVTDLTVVIDGAHIQAVAVRYRKG
jgi:hypothetical protein